jgi:predicted ester cyclase
MVESKTADSTPTGATSITSRSGSEPAAKGIARPSERIAAGDSSLRIRRELMPIDFSISLQRFVRGGTDRILLHPSSERHQAMRGFDARYVDIIDYIVRITHRIWEEKNIGYIYDVYRHNCRVTDDAGLQYGRDKIVADTVHTINAFPDIRLYADEVVWAGDEETGFFTSHRTVITGTNTGWSRFGPPTGRRITLWCIANCLSQDNEIFEEWVIYNQSAMLKQLGFDLFEKAREMGNARVRGTAPRSQSAEPTRLEGQGKPRHLRDLGYFDIEHEVRRAFHYAWNWRNLGELDRFYDERVVFHSATDRELRGLSAYKAFILSLIAMFPDIASQVDEIYWMGSETEGYLTAVRWSATATHRGYGPYGEPTGRQVRIWGLTQQRVLRGKVQEEWLVFNELDLLQQILAAEPLY